MIDEIRNKTLIEPERNKSDERHLYINLLKKCLLNTIYADSEYSNLSSETFTKRTIHQFFEVLGFEIVKRVKENDRTEGNDWPKIAHTMIGQKRLDNVQFCVEKVLQENVPGDFIETGVWRGGACILMRGILKVYGIQDRLVWVADSFEGLPPPTAEVDKRYSANYLHNNKVVGVSLETVKSNFSQYDLLDSQVRFLQGWFRDTLPKLPAEKLAVARLDGDLYESTMDSLVNLYPKISRGGFLIVDDYNAVEACKIAVQEYRGKYSIKEEIIEIDKSGIYWRKS